MQHILIVGLGGFIGANARYWLTHWITQQVGTGFPLATLLINISGSLLLGLFMAWFSGRAGLPDELRLLFATGFCGAYTTFSTYAVDTVLLGQGGQGTKAVINLLITNGLCLVAAAAGLWLGGKLS